MPNLIEVQKVYDAFLQIHTQVEDRNNSGLQEVFKSVFPISDFSSAVRSNLPTNLSSPSTMSRSASSAISPSPPCWLRCAWSFLMSTRRPARDRFAT